MGIWACYQGDTLDLSDDFAEEIADTDKEKKRLIWGCPEQTGLTDPALLRLD